jgi:hypothetical protein
MCSAIFLHCTVLTAYISSCGRYDWSWPGSFLFSLTVATTVGYGNQTPATSQAKLFTIFYTLFAVPVMFAWFGVLGEVCLNILHRTLKESMSSRKECDHCQGTGMQPYPFEDYPCKHCKGGMWDTSPEVITKDIQAQTRRMLVARHIPEEVVTGGKPGEMFYDGNLREEPADWKVHALSICIIGLYSKPHTMLPCAPCNVTTLFALANAHSTCASLIPQFFVSWHQSIPSLQPTTQSAYFHTGSGPTWSRSILQQSRTRVLGESCPSRAFLHCNAIRAVSMPRDQRSPYAGIVRLFVLSRCADMRLRCSFGDYSWLSFTGAGMYMVNITGLLVGMTMYAILVVNAQEKIESIAHIHHAVINEADEEWHTGGDEMKLMSLVSNDGMGKMIDEKGQIQISTV